MENRRIIPLLMLHDELLYNSRGFSDFTYVGDPLVAVKIFNEKEAQEICIIDTDPSRYNKSINFDLLKQIAGECFMPLSYGGGIINCSEIQNILRCGFEKVILNSSIDQTSSFLQEAVETFGSSSIIGGIDFKMIGSEALVYTNCGTRNSGVNLENRIKQFIEAGVGELLISDIDRDGTMSGLNLKLIEEICEKSPIPIIFSGGVGSQGDIVNGLQKGANAIAAASLFVYKGPLNAVLINYPDPAKIQELIQIS